MPQAGMSGIFVILMIFALVFFLIPIILFFVMMYKARRSVADWHGVISSDGIGIKKQMERSNERVGQFVDNVNELISVWIEREKKKK